MIFSRIALLLLATAVVTRTASADFNTPATPAWTRPTSGAAASASNTTYQEWDGFTSATGASLPSTIFNPNVAITTSASDSTSGVNDTDGAFLIGTPRGDIYSFSDVIHPQVIIGGYGIAGHNLNVLVEVQSWGTIDSNPGLLVNGVSASTLPGYSYSVLSSVPLDAGFGPSPVTDQTWSFTVPDTTSLELDWTWGGVSTAFQDLSVDTQSVPASVPEPASLGLLAAGVGLLICKRRQSR